jgi:starvation-inducible outer membrane lipoprotein
MFDMDEKGINNQINDKKKRMIVEYTYNLIVTKITEEQYWFIHHIYVISSTQKSNQPWQKTA